MAQGVQGSFVTHGHTGAGGDAATRECSVHVTGQDTQSSAVRSPHTASSVVPDPELFRGVTPVAASRPDCATLSFSEASVSKVPSRLDSGMVGRVLSLFKMLPGKKKHGPAAASAQQPQEPEQLQLLQDGEWQSWAAGLVLTASLAPSHPIPSHPIPSHPIPSHPIPSHCHDLHNLSRDRDGSFDHRVQKTTARDQKFCSAAKQVIEGQQLSFGVMGER